MDPAAAPPLREQRQHHGRRSIIDSLGVEIVSVISPVSICMLLVVVLITTLTSSSSFSSPPPVTAATLIYSESPSDSPSHKLLGALLDAAAFVVLITAVTFLLVLLYYYRCNSFLAHYMRFSAFFVLFSMGGSLFISILRRISFPLDAASCLLLLVNFSAIGSISVLSPAVPFLLRQSYLVIVASIVAVWFAKLPEWTTWILLLALAAYDLVAVLSPRGPLRILVDLASSRDDDLPALVYEARPAGAPAEPPPRRGSVAGALSVGSVELQPVSSAVMEMSNINDDHQAENAPLVFERTHGDQVLAGSSRNEAQTSDSECAVIEIERAEEERSPLVHRETHSGHGNEGREIRQRRPSSQSPSEVEMFDTSRGIRLGLGDFVFYSVLVGRAAMYDLMTVYACYLAIISGLGCTLILLSVCRHALPALPISITLGTIFYFLTRLLMEPFVIGASTNLVMF